MQSTIASTPKPLY